MSERELDRRGAQRDAVAFADGAESLGALDELVAYLGRALELPSGAILLTGTGIVPGGTFTLRPGDEVRIEAGPLGVLANPVVRVGRPRVSR